MISRQWSMKKSKDMVDKISDWDKKGYDTRELKEKIDYIYYKSKYGEQEKIKSEKIKPDLKQKIEENLPGLQQKKKKYRKSILPPILYVVGLFGIFFAIPFGVVFIILGLIFWVLAIIVSYTTKR